MKTFRKSFVIAALGMLVFSSCQEKANEPLPGLVEYRAPEEIMAGQSVRFSDITMDAASRVWTFEDGVPATSQKPDVDVVFSTSGAKKVSLAVTFNNGATDTKEFAVSVTEALDGTISVSSLTPMGCIRMGQNVTFSVTDIEGTPDTYAWTFEGGSPATSTEATPSVSFAGRDRDMKVTCVMSNSKSGVKATLSASYVVGNYPLKKIFPESDYDAVSFEYATFGTWNCYNGKDINQPLPYEIAEGGANGTGHCLKIDSQKINGQLNEGGEHWADCFPRDCWGSNASIEKGKKYEFVMWLRADHAEDNHRGIGCIQIISWLENWMYDSSLGKSAEEGYEGVFGVKPDFTGGNRTIMEKWFTGEEEEAANMLPDDKWHKFSVEFTAPFSAQNVYPYFRVYTDWYSALYLDEIELNLIEE